MKKSGAITVVPYHGYVPITIASNTGITSMNPVQIASGRLNAIGAQFQNYRLKSLRFRTLAGSIRAAAAITSSVFTAFIAGQSIPPTGSGDFENRTTHNMDLSYTAETRPVKCLKSELAGQFPWYKTDPQASIDANEEEVGSIRVFCSITPSSVVVEIWAVYEFKDPVDPAMGSAAPTLLEREKDRLKRILGIPDGSDFLIVPKGKTLEPLPSTSLVKK